MGELTKRINAGYVLMDSYTTPNGKTYYFLERGKLRCTIELEPSGYGYIYTSSGVRRI